MSTLALVGLAVVAVAIASDPGAQPAPAKPIAAPAQPDPTLEPLQRTLLFAKALEGEGKHAEAVRQYRKAAALGSGPAARRLGEIYLEGALGVERDTVEAIRWNRKAELRGEVLAQAVRLRMP